jgi:hypothetical protein
LFDILEAVHRLKIPFRLNTNSWWAGRKDLTIAGRTFKDGAELVRYIKSLGCIRIAFSFDKRYHGSIDSAPVLIESIRICENEGMPYEVILTGLESDIALSNYHKLLNMLGQNRLNYNHTFSIAEMVDVGGAADLENEIYLRQDNKAGCKGKGFYRPVYLHIDPYGKVRSCMNGVGMGNLGDLHEKSFPEILNEFTGNPANEMFTDPGIFEANFEQIIGPYLHMYKPLRHQCTRMIVLSRFLEMKGKGDTPENIHRKIASELNLVP